MMEPVSSTDSHAEVLEERIFLAPGMKRGGRSVIRGRGLTNTRRPVLTMRTKDKLTIVIEKCLCEPWSGFDADSARNLVNRRRLFTSLAG